MLGFACASIVVVFVKNRAIVVIQHDCRGFALVVLGGSKDQVDELLDCAWIPLPSFRGKSMQRGLLHRDGAGSVGVFDLNRRPERLLQVGFKILYTLRASVGIARLTRFEPRAFRRLAVADLRALAGTWGIRGTRLTIETSENVEVRQME